MAEDPEAGAPAGAPNDSDTSAPLPAAAAAAAAANGSPPPQLDGALKAQGSSELEPKGSLWAAEEAARRRVTLRVDVSSIQPASCAASHTPAAVACCCCLATPRPAPNAPRPGRHQGPGTAADLERHPLQHPVLPDSHFAAVHPRNLPHPGRRACRACPPGFPPARLPACPPAAAAAALNRLRCAAWRSGLPPLPAPHPPAPQLRSQYTSQLIIGCVCMAILLGCLLMTLSGMARVKRAGQVL